MYIYIYIYIYTHIYNGKYIKPKPDHVKQTKHVIECISCEDQVKHSSIARPARHRGLRHCERQPARAEDNRSHGAGAPRVEAGRDDLGPKDRTPEIDPSKSSWIFSV